MTVPCACAPLAMIDTAGFAEKLLVAVVLFVATWLFLWAVLYGGARLYPALRQQYRRRTLRRRVFAALDEAYVDGVPTEVLADELTRSTLFKDVSAAWTLVPYITEWKQRQL